MQENALSRKLLSSRVGTFQIWVGPPRCPDTFAMEICQDMLISDVGLLISDRLRVPLDPPLRLHSQGRPLYDYNSVQFYCLGDQSMLGVYGGLLGGSKEYAKFDIEGANSESILFESKNEIANEPNPNLQILKAPLLSPEFQQMLKGKKTRYN